MRPTMMQCAFALLTLVRFCDVGVAQLIPFKRENTRRPLESPFPQEFSNLYQDVMDKFREKMKLENILSKLMLTPAGIPIPNPLARKPPIAPLAADNNEVEVDKNEVAAERDALDVAEEQANIDLVDGINLMADKNETLEEVVDDVLADSANNVTTLS